MTCLHHLGRWCVCTITNPPHIGEAKDSSLERNQVFQGCRHVEVGGRDYIYYSHTRVEVFFQTPLHHVVLPFPGCWDLGEFTAALCLWKCPFAGHSTSPGHCYGLNRKCPSQALVLGPSSPTCGIAWAGSGNSSRKSDPNRLARKRPRAISPWPLPSLMLIPVYHEIQLLVIPSPAHIRHSLAWVILGPSDVLRHVCIFHFFFQTVTSQFNHQSQCNHFPNAHLRRLITSSNAATAHVI